MTMTQPSPPVLSTVIPSTLQRPSTLETQMDTSLTTTISLPTRRSSRGTKVVRFDPRTHRLITLHHAHSLTSATGQQQPIHPVSKPIVDLHLTTVLKGPDAAIWEQATTKEFGRLAQGVPGVVEGTNTLRFIPHHSKPKDRIASYCRAVCDINPAKADPYRVRLAYGGDRSDYPDVVSTPTVDTTTVKIHLNSVISTPDAKYATLDIKNFYLYTTLTRFEYMRIPVKIIPQVK